MNRIFILLILGVLTVPSINGQNPDESINPSQNELHGLYMKKSRMNKIVGWSLAGAGISMIIGGFATNVSAGWGEGNKNNGLWLSYLGGATTVISIPVLISAASNKRKARLSLKGGTFTNINKLTEKSSSLSMGLTIQF